MPSSLPEGSPSLAAGLCGQDAAEQTSLFLPSIEGALINRGNPRPAERGFLQSRRCCLWEQPRAALAPPAAEQSAPSPLPAGLASASAAAPQPVRLGFPSTAGCAPYKTPRACGEKEADPSLELAAASLLRDVRNARGVQLRGCLFG